MNKPTHFVYVATLVIISGIHCIKVSASDFQLDRRQFLAGTASVTAAAFMPKPVMAMAKFGSSSPLTARVQALLGESWFARSLNPFHMTGVIGTFDFKAVLEANPASEIATMNQWAELSAIEMAEGELEVAKLLKVPLRAVQNEVDAIRHPAKYLEAFVGRGPGLDRLLVKETSLGKDFLRSYLQVMEKRIPRFKEVIGMSLDFYTRYHGVPLWMKDYNSNFREIYTEMVRAQLGKQAAQVEQVSARESSALRRLSSGTMRLRQSCSDFVQKLLAGEPEDSSREEKLPALPAPGKTLPGQSVLSSEN